MPGHQRPVASVEAFGTDMSSTPGGTLHLMNLAPRRGSTLHRATLTDSPENLTR